MTIRTWKSGFAGLYKNADAEKVANEIEQIGDNVTPEQILEKAQDSSTELHKCFEWNNDEAAYKWRVHQARMIVCHLVVKEVDENIEKPEIRLFHKTDSMQGYKPITLIVRNEDEYELLLKRAMAELQAFKKKYGTLVELEEIINLIN